MKYSKTEYHIYVKQGQELNVNKIHRTNNFLSQKT